MGITKIICYITVITMAVICAIRGYRPLEPQDENPSWSHNSQQVVFVCYRRQATTEWDWDDYLGPYSGYDAHKLLEICVSDVDGHNRYSLTDNMVADFSPEWSPTTNQIVFARNNELRKSDIYLISSKGENLINLTNHPAYDSNPHWSPDGSKIAFISDRDSNKFDIYVMDSDGSALMRLTEMGDVFEFSWSPDGTSILFDANGVFSNELFVVHLNNKNLVQLTNDKVEDFYPVWSPDGDKVLFRATTDYFVQAYTIDVKTHEKIKLSDGSGPVGSVSWSPNGRFITYGGSIGQELHVLNLETSDITKLEINTIDKIQWSPNNQYLMYERLADWNRDGFQETKIWVVRLTDKAQWPISSW